MTNISENVLRKDLVNLALLQHHKLYEHGKNGQDTFDCAGLVWFLYERVLGINLYSGGIGLSTTTKIMTSNHGKITLFDEEDLNKDLSLINPTDILLFHRQSLTENKPTINNKYPGHLGIYLSENNFIHCTKKAGRVVISNFSNNPYWESVLVGSIGIFDSAKILKKIKRRS